MAANAPRCDMWRLTTLLKNDDYSLSIHPGFAEAWMDASVQELLQETRSVSFFPQGVRCQEKWVGFFSNSCRGYFYEGRYIEACPMPDWVWNLVARVDHRLGVGLDSVLVIRTLNERVRIPNDMARGIVTFGGNRVIRVCKRRSRRRVLDFSIPPFSLIVTEGDLSSRFIQMCGYGENWILALGRQGA